MALRVLGATVALALLSAAPAQAAGVLVDYGTDTNGKPILSASVHPPGPAQIDTYACTGSVCDGPLPVAADGQVTLGDPAPGTVFESRLIEGGAVTASARTAAWGGTFAAASPPALTGEPVVGATVSLTPGTWTGGWEPGGLGFDVVLACPGPVAPTGCWYISEADSVQLDARWTGYYLFGLSTRFSDNRLRVAGYPSPPALIASRGIEPSTQLTAPIGPVRTAPVAVPATRTLAAPMPTVALRPRALRAKGRLSIGRVTCAVRCTVQLTVSGKTSTFTALGTKALTIKPRHGRLKVKVVVDGKTLVTGTVRAR